jgi:hypothetical protein
MPVTWQKHTQALLGVGDQDQRNAGVWAVLLRAEALGQRASEGSSVLGTYHHKLCVIRVRSCWVWFCGLYKAVWLSVSINLLWLFFKQLYI